MPLKCPVVSGQQHVVGFESCPSHEVLGAGHPFCGRERTTICAATRAWRSFVSGADDADVGCQWLPMVAMNAMGVAMSCPVKHRLSLRFLHGHSLRCGKASLQLVLLLRQGVLRSCQKAKPVSISINSAFVRNIPMTSLYRRITPSLLPTRPFSPRFSLAIFAMECRVIMPRHGGFQSFCLANTANPEPDQQLLWDRRFPDTDG